VPGCPAGVGPRQVSAGPRRGHPPPGSDHGKCLIPCDFSSFLGCFSALDACFRPRKRPRRAGNLASLWPRPGVGR
jgi:hypothetical protein